MTRLLRWLRWPLGILGALLAVVLALASCLGHALPEGKPGPEAEALAQRYAQAAGGDAWARTGAVRFVFRKDTQHLWDKQRNLDRVKLIASGEVVLLDVGKKTGRAYDATGTELTGERAGKLVDKAYARFCNDTFWLNPLAKLFDEGVTRTRVVDKDGESLLIHYASGGKTPGDSYQWLAGPGELPRAWRMFVQIIKIKGLEMTWEDWVTLPTGAKVATRHRALGMDALRLSDVSGAATLEALEPGPDPFAPIVK